MNDEIQIVIERNNDSLADAADVADRLSVDGVDRRHDRSQDEGAEQVKTFEAPADEARFQRLDVDDDVRQFRQLIALEPFDDLLARPVMIVVQMQDDRVERQPFIAPFGAAAPYVLEAIEEAIEPGPDVRILIARQHVGAFVCRAERARPPIVRKILTEGLRAPSRAGGDRVGELDLIFARDLMHDGLPASCILRSVSSKRICSEPGGTSRL
jgi:hypothetical protein